MTTVKLIGFLPNGREVHFEFDTTEGEDTIVQQVALIDETMLESGILPLRPEPGVGEKREIVHYVLATIVKNDRGSAYKIYLYTERFKNKFLHLYLNDAAQGEAFKQAVGLDVHSLPIYKSKSALTRGEYPDEDAQYIVRVASPVEVFYKQNERWSPDLSEEDKKKIAKYLFVRWGGRTGQTRLSEQTEQTDSRQTGGLSDERLSEQTKQTDSRQVVSKAEPQTADRKAAVRQTLAAVQQTLGSGAQGQRRLPVAELLPGTHAGQNRVDSVREVFIEKVNNSPRYKTAPGCYCFSRDPFRKAIPECEKWPRAGKVTLSKAYSVTSTWNVPKKADGISFWEITDVQPMGEAEAEFFGGPAPDADFDFMTERINTHE
jgi:hypothetical protein